MKGGKYEGKIPEPLFPRLHVNDTEKGAPRPPPRNKMALNEQVSTPSQRVSDPLPSISPLPPVHGAMLANVVSSGQSSPASAHSIGRSSCRSTDGISNNACGSSMKTTRGGVINVKESSIPKMRCTSFQPCNFLPFKTAFLQKDEGEFKASTLVHQGKRLDYSNVQSCLNKKQYFNGTSSSLQLQTAVMNRLKISSPGDVELEGHVRFPSRESPKLPQKSQQHDKNPTSILRARENISPGISLKPLAREKLEKTSEPDETRNSKGGVHVDMSMQVSEVPRDEVVEQPNVSMSNASISESCHEYPIKDTHHRTLNLVENGNQRQEENECFPLPAGAPHRSGDILNTSVMNRLSHAVICPDDVVGMIGQKYFWKARRIIISQQRVFSMQVFELHRIIKVQRIFSGSMCLGKTLIKPSFMEEFTPKSRPEPPPSPVKSIDEVRRTKSCADNSIKNQPTEFGSNESAMWFVSPPGNQWLVPVMSPSEGLVYKPYTGPCPPPGGFLASLFGGCDSTNPTTPKPIGDFINPPYGILHGAPSMGPTYFSPYGMPVMPLCRDSNFSGPRQSLCIITSDRNVGEIMECRESSPKKRTLNDALPLFPTAPTAQDSDQRRSGEQRTQAIKVIPRNPRVASESAARIFRLIQEERKRLYD